MVEPNSAWCLVREFRENFISVDCIHTRNDNDKNQLLLSIKKKNVNFFVIINSRLFLIPFLKWKTNARHTSFALFLFFLATLILIITGSLNLVWSKSHDLKKMFCLEVYIWYLQVITGWKIPMASRVSSKNQNTCKWVLFSFGIKV